MTAIIKEATQNDYLGILTLSRQELGYELEEEIAKTQMEKILTRADHKIWVAVVSDQIIGYIHAQECDVVYARPMVNILGLAVAKAYQGMGIGRRLLSEAENWGKEKKAFAISLSSAMKRMEAHGFYRHCGFEEIKEQKKFHKML